MILSEKPFTSKSFSDYLSDGKIMASRCRDCGGVHLPPRPLCPECGGRNLQWKELKGSGNIKTFTIIHVPLTRMKVHCPYAVGVVQLEDGPSISGQILDVHDEKKIRVGSPVQAEFLKEEDRTRLCFRLTDAS